MIKIKNKICTNLSLINELFTGVKIDKSANILKNIHNSTSVNRIVDEVTAMSWADDDERQVVLGCGSKDKRRLD